VLQQVGSPRELYEHPVNLFVAGFIGSPPMNFVPGTIEDGSLHLPFGTIDLTPRTCARPSATVTGDGGHSPGAVRGRQAVDPPSLTACVQAQVDVVEWLGNEQYAYIPFPTPPRQLHVFDPASGDNLTRGRPSRPDVGRTASGRNDGRPRPPFPQAVARAAGPAMAEPLGEWDPTAVTFRDVPVGPSRHLVRFVEADDRLWALKELPAHTATREYGILREMETRALRAVRAAGVAVQPFERHRDPGHRTTSRAPGNTGACSCGCQRPTEHRRRLFDAMAVLLVDLHRNGIYWGDCSLANTLVHARRPGHPSLAGRRRDRRGTPDVERRATRARSGDHGRERGRRSLDVAARREEPPGAVAQIADESHDIADRYTQLWELLHYSPIIGLHDEREISARLRALNEAGFAVDEVRLEAAEGSGEELRMRVAVAGRTFHSQQLKALTGLDVSEGQATIVLNDLRAHHGAMQQKSGCEVPERLAASDWLIEVFTPRAELAHRALGGAGDRTQAYCDLLEVRWLLSETASADVGDEPALEALARRATPGGAAASLSFVDLATEESPVLSPELLDQLDDDRGVPEADGADAASPATEAPNGP
jgi:hypothetical protein